MDLPCPEKKKKVAQQIIFHYVRNDHSNNIVDMRPLTYVILGIIKLIRQISESNK